MPIFLPCRHRFSIVCYIALGATFIEEIYKKNMATTKIIKEKSEKEKVRSLRRSFIIKVIKKMLVKTSI